MHPPQARRRVVVMTDDVLTPKMAGPAIRAWHIAQALAVKCEVVLATTSALCDLWSPQFAVEAADQARFMELERWCDVAVVQGYLLHNVPELRTSEKVMVFDLYDPLHFEALVLTRGQPEPDRSVNVANTVGTLEEQLARGDFFICASDKQRDLWIGFLAALGRINPRTYGDDATLRRLIDVVPFGLPDVPPVHTRPALRGVVPGIGTDDEIVIWGGGLYDWFDPLTLIRAVDEVRVLRPRVRLFFLGMRHPKPDIEESGMAVAARALADDLGLTGSHVFFNDGWAAYEDRQNYLLEADVGVSLHFDHLETMYSFRTRLLDYLWAGLPIVATAGDGFAQVIAAERIGTVVPGDDVDAVADALVGLLSDPGSASDAALGLRRWRGGSGGRSRSSRWCRSAPPPARRPMTRPGPVARSRRPRPRCPARRVAAGTSVGRRACTAKVGSPPCWPAPGAGYACCWPVDKAPNGSCRW